MSAAEVPLPPRTIPAPRVELGRRASLRLLHQLMFEPIEIISSLRETYGPIFELGIPFGLTPPFTFVTTRDGYRAVLQLPPEVGRNGPVIDRVPALARWSPRSDMSDEHLQELLLAGRRAMGRHLRTRPWGELERGIRDNVTRIMQTWPATVDLATDGVALIHEVSTRCVLGDELWEALGPDAPGQIRTIVNAVDAARAVVALTPAADTLPECAATQALCARLLALVRHPASARYPFVRSMRAVEVDGHPLDDVDVAWMLFFAIWNATLYVGTYGVWSLVDWLSHPAELARLRAAPDRVDRLVDGFVETLRLNPVAWQLRALAEPIVLPVDDTLYEIPAGQFLTVFSHAPNRDPESYEEPTAWRPERYRQGEPAPLLFGAGPFGCVAQHFVKRLVATIHDEMLQRAEFALLRPLPERVCRVHLLYPQAPIPTWVHRPGVRRRSRRERWLSKLRRAPRSLALPEHASDPVTRSERIASQAEHYRPTASPLADGLPPWCEQVPRPEWFRPETPRAMARLTSIFQRLASMRLRDGLRQRFKRHEGPWDRFHAPYRNQEPPWHLRQDLWKTDEAFGYQRLGGIAPQFLERVDQLPSTFAVTDADVMDVPGWPEGQTMAQLMDQHRLWMVRHTDTEGIPTSGKILCSPQTLFVVRDDGAMVPVAIQLFVDSDAVFTPKDQSDARGTTNRWLVAKLFATNVDAQINTLFCHTILAHVVLEAAWAALCRTVSDQHPLRAFLAPHGAFTLVIGEMFRDSYATPTGDLVNLHQAGFEGTWALARRLFQRWSFAELDIPAHHAARGWDTPDEPPNFVYRDDSRAHYDLLHSYVTEVIEALYESDGALQRDAEVQAWVGELGGACRLRGLPVDDDGGLSSRDQLITLVTGLLFQAVVQHSLVDASADTYYGFAPNLPLSLTLEPPRDHHVRYTDAEVAAGLPNDRDVVLQHALASSNHPPDNPPFYQSVAGRYPSGWLEGLDEDTRSTILEAAARWRDGLEALGDTIDARNEAHWPAPFDALHPRQMSNSVWF